MSTNNHRTSSSEELNQNQTLVDPATLSFGRVDDSRTNTRQIFQAQEQKNPRLQIKPDEYQDDDSPEKKQMNRRNFQHPADSAENTSNLYKNRQLQAVLERSVQSEVTYKGLMSSMNQVNEEFNAIWNKRDTYYGADGSPPSYTGSRNASNVKKTQRSTHSNDIRKSFSPQRISNDFSQSQIRDHYNYSNGNIDQNTSGNNVENFDESHLLPSNTQNNSYQLNNHRLLKNPYPPIVENKYYRYNYNNRSQHDIGGRKQDQSFLNYTDDQQFINRVRNNENMINLTRVPPSKQYIQSMYSPIKFSNPTDESNIRNNYSYEQIDAAQTQQRSTSYPVNSSALAASKRGNLDVIAKEQPFPMSIDFQNHPHQHYDRFNIETNDPFELRMLLRREIQHTIKLEQSLKKKDNLLQQMNEFRNELCLQFETSQNQLRKLQEESQTSQQQATHTIFQLQEEIVDLQSFVRKLQRENFQLKSTKYEEGLNPGTGQRTQGISRDNDLYEKELWLRQIEMLELKNESLDREVALLSQQRVEFQQLLDNDREKLEIIQSQNAKLSHNSEKYFQELRQVITQKEDLLATVQDMRTNRMDRDETFKLRLHEAMIDFRQKQEEQTNIMITEKYHKFHLKEKSMKDKISTLTQEIELLKEKNQQNAIPSRRLKQSEARINHLEKSLQELAAATSTGNVAASSTSVTNNNPELAQLYKVLNQIYQELEINVHNPRLIHAAVIQLIETNQTYQKFIDCISDMVVNCHPVGTFASPPSLQHSWKWLQKMMEDFMNLQKEIAASSVQTQAAESGEYRENSRNINSNNNHINQELSKEDFLIVNRIYEMLEVKQKQEVIPRITELLVDEEVSKRLIPKFKFYFKLEWLKSLSDVQKILQMEENKYNFPKK